MRKVILVALVLCVSAHGQQPERIRFDVADGATERGEFKDAWQQERRERVEMQAMMQAKSDGQMMTIQKLEIELGIMKALHARCSCDADKVKE